MKIDVFMFIKICLKVYFVSFKGAICKTFTVLNYKMSMLYQQLLRKHAKLKYLLVDKNPTAKIILFSLITARPVSLFMIWSLEC